MLELVGRRIVAEDARTGRTEPQIALSVAEQMVDVLFGLCARNVGERVMAHGTVCLVEPHQVERGRHPEHPAASRDVPDLRYAATEYRLVVDGFQPHPFAVEPYEPDTGGQQQAPFAVVDDLRDVVSPSDTPSLGIPNRRRYVDDGICAQVDAVDAVEKRRGPQPVAVGIVMERFDDRIVRDAGERIEIGVFGVEPDQSVALGGDPHALFAVFDDGADERRNVLAVAVRRDAVESVIVVGDVWYCTPQWNVPSHNVPSLSQSIEMMTGH